MKNRPNLAVVVGSIRRGSKNRTLANNLPDLCPFEANFLRVVGIRDLPHFDPGFRPNSVPQAALMAGEVIKAADGVVILTPEYNRSIPSGLKNLLDWLGLLETKPFGNKPVLVQSVCSNSDYATLAQSHLRDVLYALEATVLSNPEVIVQLTASIFEGGRLNDLSCRKLIVDQFTVLEDFLRQRAN